MSPPELSSTPTDFQVKARMVGKRIDAYLASRFPDYSRSVVQKVIDAGAVLVNGQPVKASYQVRLDDQIRVWLPELADEAPAPEDIPIPVVYEDEALVVVNKPPGMVTHPAKGNWSGTLVNALQFHFDTLSTVGGEHRPGIVHRLDRDTSGLLIVAKDDRAHQRLAAAVRGADDPQGVPGAGRGGPRARQRLHRAADRLPPDQPREDGHPPARGRRQGGGDVLRGPGAVPGVRPGALPARDGADAPDPGPPGARRPPDPGRQGCTRAATASPAATCSAPARPTPTTSCSPARRCTPTPCGWPIP